MQAFLAWWREQLAEMLPSWLHRKSPFAGDALVVAASEPLERTGSVTAWVRRGGNEAPLGTFALDDPGLAELPRSSARPAVISLGNGAVLERMLSLPLRALPDLDQVLAFEMDRETPFTPEEVYWEHQVEAIDRRHGRLTVRLLLLVKSNLAPLLAALAQVGITPSWIEVSDRSGKRHCLSLSDASGQRRHRSSRLFRPIAACFAVLATAALTIPLVRQAMELAALDREANASLSAADQAQALRRDIEQFSRNANLVQAELNRRARPLAVLAAVTRLLPDDTYLSELELRQNTLRLSGRSAGAARLIGLLAADGELQNPAFVAPVTRVEGPQPEIFSLVADVGPPP